MREQEPAIYCCWCVMAPFVIPKCVRISTSTHFPARERIEKWETLSCSCDHRKTDIPELLCTLCTNDKKVMSFLRIARQFVQRRIPNWIFFDLRGFNLAPTKERNEKKTSGIRLFGRPEWRIGMLHSKLAFSRDTISFDGKISNWINTINPNVEFNFDLNARVFGPTDTTMHGPVVCVCKSLPPHHAFEMI